MRFEQTADPGTRRVHPGTAPRRARLLQPYVRCGVAREAGIDPASFLQDSVSRSRRGVIRGLHVRIGAGEAKLVRCSSGAIFDVVVDLRPGSPTFRRWLQLRPDRRAAAFHLRPTGLCATASRRSPSTADTSYRIDRPHDPSEDLTIAFDDPELAIPWPRTARP